MENNKREFFEILNKKNRKNTSQEGANILPGETVIEDIAPYDPKIPSRRKDEVLCAQPLG